MPGGGRGLDSGGGHRLQHADGALQNRTPETQLLATRGSPNTRNEENKKEKIKNKKFLSFKDRLKNVQMKRWMFGMGPKLPGGRGPWAMVQLVSLTTYW